MTLKIPGRLPSWNAILGMSRWQRLRLKHMIQAEFLSALRASAADSLTRTTSARSTMSIAADTLAAFLATRRRKQQSKRRNANLVKTKANTPR